jgi:hypothetical protein
MACLYSGARSKMRFSVTAPFNPAAGTCPPWAIRLRWASSQWAPSKNRVGFRLGPSMASRHSALTVILSGWERAVCKRHAYRNASRMVAGPRRCRMCRWSASSFPAAIRNHPGRLGGEESPSWYKHCNCNATADPNRLGRGLRPAIGSDQAPERFEIADQNRRLAEIYQALAMPVLKNFVDAFPTASGHVAELSLGDVKLHRCAL